MFHKLWATAPDTELMDTPPFRQVVRGVDVAGHEAPAGMTLDEAHAAMQAHIRCMSTECPLRRAALAVLVGTGNYILADPPANRVAGAAEAER